MVCREGDVQSYGYDTLDEQPPRPRSIGIRSAILDSLEVPKWLFMERHFGRSVQSHLGTAFVYICYGTVAPSRGKEKTPVNVKELVDKWVPAVVGLTCAHDKQESDEWEAQVDELLKPLLSCPVKQLREFYHQLLAAMKAEPKCPFIVWRSLETWGECMVDGAPDEGVKRLKKKLASEIVELCEEQVLPQFPEAMVRALMWRDPAQLEEVKAAVKGGEKVRIRGRQSCLFMHVGRGRKEVTVQL